MLPTNEYIPALSDYLNEEDQIIILMGPPGSGKTKLAYNLELYIREHTDKIPVVYNLKNILTARNNSKANTGYVENDVIAGYFIKAMKEWNPGSIFIFDGFFRDPEQLQIIDNEAEKFPKILLVEIFVDDLQKAIEEIVRRTKEVHINTDEEKARQKAQGRINKYLTYTTQSIERLRKLVPMLGGMSLKIKEGEYNPIQDNNLGAFLLKKLGEKITQKTT